MQEIQARAAGIAELFQVNCFFSNPIPNPETLIPILGSGALCGAIQIETDQLEGSNCQGRVRVMVMVRVNVYGYDYDYDYSYG